MKGSYKLVFLPLCSFNEVSAANELRKQYVEKCRAIILVGIIMFLFKPVMGSYTNNWAIDTQQDWQAGETKTNIDTVVLPGSIRIDYKNSDLLNNDFEFWGNWTNSGNREFVRSQLAVYHGNYSVISGWLGQFANAADARLRIKILNTSNNTLWENIYWTDFNGTWNYAEISLLAWKGQTIKIVFEPVKSNGSYPAFYYAIFTSDPFVCSGGTFSVHWRGYDWNEVHNQARYAIDFTQGGRGEFYNSGNYISRVYNTGIDTPYYGIFEANYQTNGQTITFAARTADNTQGLAIANWYPVTPGSKITGVSKKRWCQFKVEMQTASADVSPVVDWVRINWFVDTSPLLAWVGDSNYQDKGVSPISGNPNQIFTYRVKYIDQDNDPPKSGYPKLHILRSGIEIAGSPFTMLEENPGDNNYADGKIYYYSIQLTQEGNYSYYFEAQDNWTYLGDVYNLVATGEPTQIKLGPQVKILAPYLTWNSDWKNMRDKGIVQLSMLPGTEAVYRVDYYDPHNYAPLYVRVHILNSGVDISGSPFDMSIVENPPYNYTKGATYQYKYVMNTEGNSYTYYFEAKNIWGDLATGEPTLEHKGPDVSNNSPYLSHTGEPGYTNDMHEPGNDGANDTGISNITVFNFRVKYTDLGNYAPATGWPKIYFYKVNDVDTGTKAVFQFSDVMEKDNPGDNVYTDGCIYKYSTTLPGGKWSYRIMAYNTQNWGTRDDGSGALGECPHDVNDQNAYIFVSVAPQLTLDQVSPNWGDTGTNFAFTVKYSDADSDSPMVGYYQNSIWYWDRYPKLHILKDGSEISGSPFLMNAVGSDTDYYNGKDYTYNLVLSSGGNYTYYFEAKDKLGWYTKTNTKTFQVSSGNPIITWCADSGYKDGRTPASGDTNTVFTWRIIYQDSDNDPPKAGYPKLHILKNGLEIDSAVMNEEAGGSYITGKYFSYSRTLPVNNANYSYWVEVYDQQNWIALGEAGNTVTAKFVSNKPEEPKDMTEYPGQVTASKLTLKWQSTDPDGDTLIYRVYVGTDPGNLQLVWTGTKTEYTLENLKNGIKYYWKVEAEDPSGQKTTMLTSSFTVASSSMRLLNWPNPFNPIKESTNIVFNADENGQADIRIYNEFGEKIFDTSISVSPGTNSYSYNGRDSWGNILENGTYVVVVKTSTKLEKHVILILKK